ncbi:MAG: hypothetical protein AAF253_07160 [Pseudomonadota bacterium]
MTLRLVATLIAAGALAGPGFTEELGTLTKVGGDEGSVTVIRDGTSTTIKSGFTLQPGDRIVVRGNGQTTLEAEGCVQTLEAPAMTVIGDTPCEDQIVRLAEPSAKAQRVAATSTTGASNGAAAGTATSVLGVAGLAAVVGDSEGGSASSSPSPVLDGSSAIDTAESRIPVTDTPTSALFSDDFEAGSGLDTGLFGFFEATSS